MSCKKPYNPPYITPVTGFLVVEGVIDAGNDSTVFKLSRTVNLDSSIMAPVTGAHVTVEGSNSASYPLNENTSGTYTAAPLNLDKTQQYRIHIVTTNGEDYVSDYAAVKITPPIDTVQYQIKSNGLQINLNTHDPANNTRYYRWDYSENWEFHSEYYSGFYSNGDTVLFRQQSRQVYVCYQNDNSSTVTLGSSAKLVQDIISAQPIIFISSTSEKIETEYSIQINQYALTSDAYAFWQLLKTNTEDLGSIFDAQPSEITGNIHCTNNPSERVIGYISASTVQTKRIFIYNSSLPQAWQPDYPASCEIDSVFLRSHNSPPNEEDAFFNFDKSDFVGPLLIPINRIINSQGMLSGHTGSTQVCVDCTIRGTTTKPSFWP